MKRLALLFVILALLPGVINAQGPLELDADAEFLADESDGRITFQYPSAWEFGIDTEAYIATRASLLDDFEFEGDDLIILFTSYEYQAYDYDYNEDTDPVEYLRAIIDNEIAEGLDVMVSEEMTIGSFNTIYEVYEQQGLQANVFGMYEEGIQPIVIFTIGLPDAFAAHEETVSAILETVEFDPTYNPYLETLNEFVTNADLSEAQPVPPEGETQIFSLTADDEFVAFTYEAEAGTLGFFRVDEAPATEDDQRGPGMLVVGPDGNFLASAGGTRTASSTPDGESVFYAFSQVVVDFTESGTYTLLVGMNGVFDGAEEPIAADLEIYYLPVMEVSGAEPIEVAHTAGQQHLFVTEEVYDQAVTITAYTADNTGLKLEIRADYMDDATTNLSSKSFVIQDPDSTIPMTMDPYYDPEFSKPARLVIWVSEEELPREGELIPDVETTLTVTIE